ncbi:putative UDP-glycosyltransferase 73B5 [Iris pallida]|uniref:UDP-glycosyltransferase 73B5 n=1 Tax=Iris pallida TaxID=29817 RepID=A0AAX6DME2_IRIPA|nr:putative UDP-glycosyltransferase 73B5 [Iris pallida]
MAKDHIVIFPFMAKGHTIPLIHFAAALSSRNLRITIVTTPGNAPFILQSLPSHSQQQPLDVDLLLLPFPHCPPLPAECESTDQLPSFDLYPLFVGATTLLRQPFERLLHQLMSSDSPPLCLVSDFFLGWTLDICKEVDLPRLVFHGMSTFSMSLCKSLWTHLPHLPVHSEDPFHVPGTPSTLLVTRDVIPDTVLGSVDPLNPATQFLSQLGDSDVNSWGVLVNSFAALDGDDYVRLFESFYQQTNARAWLLGPLSLLSESLQLGESKAASATTTTARGRDDGLDIDEYSSCIEWLNKDNRPPRSVVYVSFGTQAHVSEEQLEEVAHGLEESSYDYIWVVRSEKWSPPTKKGKLNKGKIVRWAPQVEVLKHGATGGFVSHCGWNSVLEGVSAGVPFLAWPMIAEQHLNAKHLVEELGAGLRFESTAADGTSTVVRREEVRDGVRELMGGERGRKARERVVELSEKAKVAVADGGSSRRTLGELIDALRSRPPPQVVLHRTTKGEMVQVEEEEEELQFEFRDGIRIG